MTLDEIEEEHPENIVDTQSEKDQQNRRADTGISLCRDERERVDCRGNQQIIGLRPGYAAIDKTAQGQTAHRQYGDVQAERNLSKSKGNAQYAGKGDAGDDAFKNDAFGHRLIVRRIGVEGDLAKIVSTAHETGNDQKETGHGNIVRPGKGKQHDESINAQRQGDQDTDAGKLAEGFKLFAGDEFGGLRINTDLEIPNLFLHFQQSLKRNSLAHAHPELLNFTISWQPI